MMRSTAAITIGSAAQLDALRLALAEFGPDAPAAEILAQLIRLGLDQLPLPGGGATLARWRALAAVAEHDLSLAKLYEGHTDALAIHHELGVTPVASAGAAWGVWAAESATARTVIEAGRLYGAKAWCSGAATGSHALLTAWEGVQSGSGSSGNANANAHGNACQRPQLVSVALAQPGVRVTREAWRAVGMNGSASLDVAFDGALAARVGAPGDYLTRPGFWHGGAGIAACWYGGARALATTLHRALAQTPAASRCPFRRAALGRVDVALHCTGAALREAAAWIDAHPAACACGVAQRVRLAAERCATHVFDVTGRALGATPFCRDARFARCAADLAVFVRQSHAERDGAALGDQTLDSQETPWSL